MVYILYEKLITTNISVLYSIVACIKVPAMTFYTSFIINILVMVKIVFILINVIM